MSYITETLSPYRSTNLKETCIEILEEDSKYVCDSFEEKGLSFILAYICVIFLSFLKVLYFIIQDRKKPIMTWEHLELKRGMNSESITDILSRRKALSEDVPALQNHDNLCPNDKVKEERVSKVINLRTYLYQHDLTLHAYTLKRVNHRVTDDELVEMYRTGVISKPLSTTTITFNNPEIEEPQDLNKLLKEVFPNIIDLRVSVLRRNKAVLRRFIF